MDNNTENTVHTLLSLLLIWSRSQIETTITADFFEYANKRKHRLTPCLPFNGKEDSSPLLCPWSSHGLYVIQLRLRSRACVRVGSLASVP